MSLLNLANGLKRAGDRLAQLNAGSLDQCRAAGGPLGGDETHAEFGSGLWAVKGADSQLKRDALPLGGQGGGYCCEALVAACCARRARSTRLVLPVLRRMLETWELTVFSLRNKARAISL